MFGIMQNIIFKFLKIVSKLPTSTVSKIDHSKLDILSLNQNENLPSKYY